MSIYSFGYVEMQAYKSIHAAIQNLSTHAIIPVIDMEKALSIYKKALSESVQGYMYNQNQIKMRRGYSGCEIEFELCAEFGEGRIQTDIRVIPEIAEIMNLARKKNTVYEKIKTVYTYFVKNFEYKYEQAEELRYHSAISAFLYRKSVCEGFALSFANILNRLEIPCGIITGYAAFNVAQGLHTWNVVELDKNCYHLDVTCDICTKEKERELFDYFLLDDGLIRRDHIWSDGSVPSANDSTKELYTKRGLCFRNEQECINAIVTGLKQKKPRIDFRFVSEKNSADASLETARSFFNIAQTQTQCNYRSVSFSANNTSGTIHYSVKY